MSRTTMTIETLFGLSNNLALPFWILMVVAPGWRVTERIISSPWIVAPFAAIYTVLIIPRAGALLPTLASPELEPVASLLGTPEGAALGWIHFLAFDLFVGRWIYMDSRERHFSPLWMAPVLILVLMFGPLGLLVYLIGRAGVEAIRVRGLAGEEPRGGGAAKAYAWSLYAFRAGVRINAPLAYTAAAMVPLLGLTLIAVVLDPRVITGAPAWLKPAKFAASLSIYAFTLLWLLGRVKGRRRLVSAIGAVSAVALAVEWLVVALQAYRGTTSHFNVAAALDGTLFSVMGVFVVMIWLANLVAAGLLILQPETDGAFAWGLRLGLITALIGGAMGGAMLRPTEAQLAAMQSGNLTSVGAHTVGSVDGGPGMPVTGWSTIAGDVRVPHFFGLHGLQVIPLVGWLIARHRRFRPGQQLRLVCLAGLSYLTFTGILFWQALRGESVVSPGPETLIALGALTAIAAALAAGILLPRGRKNPFLTANLESPTA